MEHRKGDHLERVTGGEVVGRAPCRCQRLDRCQAEGGLRAGKERRHHTGDVRRVVVEEQYGGGLPVLRVQRIAARARRAAAPWGRGGRARPCGPGPARRPRPAGRTRRRRSRRRGQHRTTPACWPARARSHLRVRCARMPCAVTAPMLPRRDPRPGRLVCLTTPADAQVTSASGRSAGSIPSRSGCSRSSVTVASRRGPVGQAEAAVAVDAQLPPQVADRRQQPRPQLALAPRQRLELARLLERVDPHLRVAADRERHAGLARRSSPAGSRRRGCPRSLGTRRPWSPSRARIATSSSDTWIPWITLADGPRKPVCSSSSIGEQPCSARHSSSSRRCSWACTWRTSPWRSEYSAIASSQPRGTARTLWAATPTRDAFACRCAQARSASTRARKRLDVGIAEPPLTLERRQVASVPAGAVIGGGQHHDLQTRARPPPRRPRSAIALRSSYGVPSGWWWT